MQKPSQADRCQHLKHVLSAKQTYLLNHFFHWGGPEGGHPLLCRLRKWKSRSLWTFLSFSLSLPTSLCCMARLAPCYHGNKDWCGMASLRREKDEKERERVVHLQSPTSSRKPWGHLLGETKRHEFIPYFLSQANVFFLQHQHWLVLLSLPRLSPHSVLLSLPSFCPHPFFFVCPCLLASFTPRKELVMTVV